MHLEITLYLVGLDVWEWGSTVSLRKSESAKATSKLAYLVCKPMHTNPEGELPGARARNMEGIWEIERGTLPQSRRTYSSGRYEFASDVDDFARKR